ncbi:hypothetical protein [Methylobacterium soli]|uniref:Uncharacterized protein n=1 Tax=Methylobacterium soli TaxID=553447 RepID=A0A6L3SZJ7_9HYPH|nr:hypothetical protein [Methylobacterium soli]KAB1075915.1 hypothetical protein F6X53_24090 [Methylobacterium soli]GJE41855.1 hypothetical protein AEGHOMDF_1024 [Methylobacterium soli]
MSFFPKDISHGSPDAVRAEIHDLLWVLSHRVTAALDSLQIGDDFAVTRAMRLGALEFDSAASLLVVLEDTKVRERERRCSPSRQRERVPG